MSTMSQEAVTVEEHRTGRADRARLTVGMTAGVLLAATCYVVARQLDRRGSVR